MTSTLRGEGSKNPKNLVDVIYEWSLWGWIKPKSTSLFTIHLGDVPPRLGVAGDELPAVGVGPPEALPAAAHDHRARRVVRRAQLAARLRKVGDPRHLQARYIDGSAESLCLGHSFELLKFAIKRCMGHKFLSPVVTGYGLNGLKMLKYDRNKKRSLCLPFLHIDISGLNC